MAAGGHEVTIHPNPVAAPGLRRCAIPAAWIRAQARWSSCSGACPCSRRWSAPTSSGSRRWRCRARSSRARWCSARATRATRATSSARATRARSAATATGARSRSRPSAPATSSASSRCSRTSAARRPSRRSSRRAWSAVLGPDMRRLMGEHPDIAMRLVIALGRRLRETNERLSRQSFQTVQSRVAVVLGELVDQAVAEGRAPSDVLVTATQADLAQLAGLLARVGQPLPGGARARRGDLPGPRPPGRARPRGAEAICLLAGRNPSRRPGRRAPRRASSRPAAWSCAATRWW